MHIRFQQYRVKLTKTHVIRVWEVGIAASIIYLFTHMHKGLFQK